MECCKCGGEEVILKGIMLFVLCELVLVVVK